MARAQGSEGVCSIRSQDLGRARVAPPENSVLLVGNPKQGDDVQLLEDVMQWILSVGLIVMFLGAAYGNWQIAYTTIYKRERCGPHVSYVFLAGGLVGSMGVWLCPLDAVSRYWWLPLVLDFGCAPYIVIAIVFGLLWRRRKPTAPESRDSHE